MKSQLVILVIGSLMAPLSGTGAEPPLPPHEVRATWDEPAVRGFKDWKIKHYDGWGEALDGGSKVFRLRTSKNLKFEIAAVSPQYWTDDEKKTRTQVFYLIHENRFYRIKAKSEQEQALVAMLRAAEKTLKGDGDKDPKHLGNLADRLLSRKSWF